MASKINTHKKREGIPQHYTVTYTDRFGSEITSVVFWNKSDAIRHGRFMNEMDY